MRHSVSMEMVWGNPPRKCQAASDDNENPMLFSHCQGQDVQLPQLLSKPKPNYQSKVYYFVSGRPPSSHLNGTGNPTYLQLSPSLVWGLGAALDKRKHFVFSPRGSTTKEAAKWATSQFLKQLQELWLHPAAPFLHCAAAIYSDASDWNNFLAFLHK